MMKLIAGYQLRPDGQLVDLICASADRVGEVYFAWPGIANGRSTVARKLDLPEWTALERQRDELQRIARAGIGMNLLLNANCYGAESLSRSFFERIGDLIDDVKRELGLAAVTTASPVVARFVKQNFPSIEVRASVNMEIGTREGVEYLADAMDGFYIKREMNRQVERVAAFSKACRDMGKKVYLLANSGCLNYCSARTFHDNLVSHEAALMKMDNAFTFDGLCRRFLSAPEQRRRILEVSNWVRPEDLRHYEPFVDGAKLAMRVSENPEMILRAYASGRFAGNLLSLTEPDFSALYRPMALSASRLPPNFFEYTSACDRDCARCGYCARAFDRAIEPLPEDVLL